VSLIRVASFSISLDGYAAGPDQELDHPMGVGGMALHGWALATQTFRRMHFGAEDGTIGVDDRFAIRGFENLGAWIIGRHMFGPIRGAWPDHEWKGWWGETPPYHVPVFVLTHHARPPLEMAGGTTFHFVTGGADEALRLARAAAGDRDVRIGGGAATVRQYLRTAEIDEMHLAVAPVLLGRGEHLLDGIDLPALGYQCTEQAASDLATHVVIRHARLHHP
jgi:dihydrofolate reductase